jgi:hypothetical protein
MKLERSSSFNDLQPGSLILTETRKRTEEFIARQPDAFKALKASIAWANPDNVVITETYSTDYMPVSVDGTDHLTVCKPRTGTNMFPWTFVESGGR